MQVGAERAKNVCATWTCSDCSFHFCMPPLLVGLPQHHTCIVLMMGINISRLPLPPILFSSVFSDLSSFYLQQPLYFPAFFFFLISRLFKACSHAESKHCLKSLDYNFSFLLPPPPLARGMLDCLDMSHIRGVKQCCQLANPMPPPKKNSD